MVKIGEVNNMLSYVLISRDLVSLKDERVMAG